MFVLGSLAGLTVGVVIGALVTINSYIRSMKL